MTPDHANGIPAERDANAVEASSPGITGPEICARCHKLLTKRGADGECLRCLVGFALTPEDTDGDVAHASPLERLRQQNVIYGHFELAAAADGSLLELGHGAMGTTYRAQDTVLRTAVALKVIEQSVAEHPAARARFLREARAAASLHHPNVATVSHYGEQDGQCYYVMELVEGETVEARVRRDGPLPVALALEIAAQVARALAAAEARGIVHRDLKPSNLMLATTEREENKADVPLVKVIDFGLAKVISDAGGQEMGAADTRSGFVGTPAFASPEQFARAEDSRIDSRSDIYSLGVTLWYLLCGQTPFLGVTLEEIHARQVKEPLPLKQLNASKVPARVVGLLRSMLAVHPRDRFQSARELLDAITRCQEEFPLIKRKSTYAGRRRRWTLFASVLIIGGIVTLAGWRHFLGSPPPSLDASIAVLPFENLSPDSADAFFTVGMQDEITADLARIAALKVIGSDSTRSYSAQDLDLAKVGRELGVQHLLTGSVRRERNSVHVTVRLSDLRHPASPWTGQFDRRLDDVFAVQGEITRAVADRLNIQLSGRQKAAVDAPPTTDLAAYDLYLQAQAIPHVTGTTESAAIFPSGKRAIQLLDEAVARDPKFVLACCALAWWHDDLCLHQDAGSPEDNAIDHRSLAEAALAKAERAQPDAGELHLAKAVHALKINHDAEQADRELQLARPALPNNGQLEAVASRIARRQDHWDVALRCLERAATLEPRDLELHDLLSQTYRFLRRYDDFDRSMADAIALTPAGQRYASQIIRVEGLLDRSGDLQPYHAFVTGQVDAHLIDDETAREDELLYDLWNRDTAALFRVVARSPQTTFSYGGVHYPVAWYKALGARMLGDQKAAATAFEEARVELEKQTFVRPGDGILLSVLAIANAGIGHGEQAVQEAQRACELTTFTTNNLYAPTVRCNLAVVYAWTGQKDLAFAELNKLVDRPAGSNVIFQPTYGDLRLNPLWEPLRDDPRFAELARRLAPEQRLK